MAIGSAWLMLAGVVALGRADRLLPYLGAAAFTVVSLPLIVGGLAIGLLLGAYLVVEDAPTGFKAIRKRWKLGKSPDAPATERKEAVARAQEAAAGSARVSSGRVAAAGPSHCRPGRGRRRTNPTGSPGRR